MPRLGRVELKYSFVVDLDNADMVDAAQQALPVDVFSAIQSDEIDNYISVYEDPTANTGELAEFLLADVDDNYA